MSKRLNGRKIVDEVPPIVPLVEAGGRPVPLPPLDQLHADGMPGGSLHRSASDKDAGFMTPEHVNRLERVEKELEKRPPFKEGDFAPFDHEHPPVLPEHGHPVLSDHIGGVKKELDSLQSLVRALESRTAFDPSQWAKKDHSHAPSPLPPHEHPQYEELVGASNDRIDELRVEQQRTVEEVQELSGKIETLIRELEFVRNLAEKAIESKTRRQEHGHLGGGALHELANDRLAGFLSVENLRRLELLWNERESKK